MNCFPVRETHRGEVPRVYVYFRIEVIRGIEYSRFRTAWRNRFMYFPHAPKCLP